MSGQGEEVSVNRLGEGSTDQGGWHSALVCPASLASVVIDGNGKDADLVIAGMLLIGLIGLTLDTGIRRLERLPSIRWGVSSD